MRPYARATALGQASYASQNEQHVCAQATTRLTLTNWGTAEGPTRSVGSADRSYDRRLPMPFTDEALQRWKHFTGSANWSMLHPYDWGRFHDYLIAVHRGGMNLDDAEFSDLLQNVEGVTVPESTRQELMTAFNSGLELLQRYDAWLDEHEVTFGD